MSALTLIDTLTLRTGRTTTSTLRCRAGTPTAPRPRTARPFACWTGSHPLPAPVSRAAARS
jgi:hypothetical protein